MDLRTSLFGFIDTAVKVFDSDPKTTPTEIGLDEQEWGRLISEINLEAQRYLEKERRITLDIEAITRGALSSPHTKSSNNFSKF